MMKKYVKVSALGAILVVVPAVPQAVEAQQPQQVAGRALSIEEALRMATTTSEQVAVASAGVTRARGQQIQAKSQYYPQVNGFVNYSRALASEFADVFGSGSDTTTTTEPDTTGGGGIDFSNLPFGRKNTYTFGLALQQNLFTGGRIKAQNRVADASRRVAEITLSSEQAQVTLDVAQAYFDAVLAQRLLDIADASLAQSERALAQAKLSRQVGNQSEFELLRAQVTRDNQGPLVIQQRSMRDLAVLRLKQLLDIPADQQITLTSDLLGDTLAPIAGFAPVASAAIAASMDSLSRAPVRQAAEGLQIQNATLDITQSQRYPAVSLTSNYARVNYPSNVLPQFNDLRTNWTAGLSLQVPLFTGGRLKGERVVAEANVSQARAQLRQTQELAALDTRSAYEQLMAADAAWQASSGTVTQAQRAHDIAELRYREGISTQLELNDARLLLQQAQANRARSARDLQVARIKVVLLPDLPLGAGSAAGGMGAGGSAGGQPGGMGGGGAGAGGMGVGGAGGAGGAGAPGGGAGGQMGQGGGFGGGVQ